MDDLGDRLLWFEEKILPHQAALRTFLRRILPSSYDQEDIVAESLVRALSARNWLAVENGRAFLRQIARNLVIDQVRKASVVSIELMADLDDPQRSQSPCAMLEARDALRNLEKIVAAMPQKPREVFLLKRVHGHSLNDIAASMDITVSTVEKHLTRALWIIARADIMSEDGPSDAVVQKSVATRRN